MEFSKTNRFSEELVRSKIMGPNTLKLCEELLDGETIAPGSVVPVTAIVRAELTSLTVVSSSSSMS